MTHDTETQGETGGSAFTITDVSVNDISGDTSVVDVYPYGHSDASTDADNEPPFSVTIDPGFTTEQYSQVQFFLESISGENLIGEVAKYVNGQTTFTRYISWEDIINDAGFTPGTYQLYASVVVSSNQKSMAGPNVTLHETEPGPIDPGKVSVFACDVMDKPVPIDTTTGFTAQVTNNNDQTVTATVEWYADGTLVGTEVADIPANTGQEFTTTGVSHGYLLDRAGPADSALTAEVVEVVEP